jgi:hypothetical protein
MTEVEARSNALIDILKRSVASARKPFFVCIFSGDPLVASSSQALPQAF